MMAEEKIKIYHPETIEDSPPPGLEGEAVFGISQKTKEQIHSPTRIKDRSFPTKHIAIEVIGSALNTKARKILGEFQFTETGALQIGKFQQGVSGDIKISPNGIVARDNAGNTVFTLDGSTGDAVFKGTIQTGALIAGTVVVGNNSLIFDGKERRIIVNDGTTDRVLIGKF